MQGLHVQFTHLQLGFEQFGSIIIICKSNIKIYITWSLTTFELKRNTLLVAIVALALGILAYQSALNQIADILNIIEESRAGLGPQYSNERLQVLSDDAQATLMYAKGILGFSILMVFYALYDDIMRIVKRIR